MTRLYPRPMAWEVVRAVVAIALLALGGYYVLRRRALAERPRRGTALSMPVIGYAYIGIVFLAVGAMQLVLLVVDL